jgi:CheY-like chemotaxis protein
LGLATIYGAVKQNNGFINVYSERGKGTTFSIYLPRYAGETTHEVADKAQNQVLCGGAETILVVEDEPDILTMTTMILERLGYSVVAASSPEEALNVAREYDGGIDLLMTDLIMPEMNGKDLAESVMTFRPGIKRLYMSGYTSDIISHHGVLDEGVHFIQKPFSMASLGATIRNVLDGSDV